MPRKTRKSALKPSGYDVVIRNRNRIRDLNRRIAAAVGTALAAQVRRKDALIDEMQAACPHESMLQADGVKTLHGEIRLRCCTSCGLVEGAPMPRYVRLRCRPGRLLKRVDRDAFQARLALTLRWTGINMEKT